ncbi:MAG: cbb3-type cytochrome c oxidase subunit I [Opitutales bacterium]|nr:cbb3-type cytochrome c oxidase subunit I [Opitutales bacterium]
MKQNSEQIIDKSLKLTVCFFVASAGLWLLAAALLAYISAAKLTDPFFLSSFEFLSYGKVKIAQANAFVYGWGGNSIFAVTLWVVARLSQAEARGKVIVLFAGFIWNLAITFGLLGILDGHMTPHEMLEMPAEIWPALFISYSIIAFFIIVTHRSRRNSNTIAPQWFLLSSLLWFPMLFLIAWNGLEINPARGTVQSVLSMWFGQSLIWLWLTPVALGAAYYIIPAILGRAIDKYYLAVFGFWCIALLAPWSVVHHLEGGPVPMWIPAIGTVMSIAMIFPIAVASTNFHSTAFLDISKVWNSLPLRFVIFGTLSYTASSYIGVIFSLPAVAKITQFSIINDFHFNQRVYGFFSMIIFGMVYHILPKITGNEIAKGAKSFHFWTSAFGVLILLLAYLIGGLTHGVLAQQPSLNWASSVISSILPYFQITELAFVVLGFSQLVFVVNVWKAIIPNPFAFFTNDDDATNSEVSA